MFDFVLVFDHIVQFVQSLHIIQSVQAVFSAMNVNILDVIIVLVILFYAYEGYVLGFFIVLAFLLTVIVSLPSSPFVKRAVTGSEIGSQLIAHTSSFERKLDDVFGGALDETLGYLTVEPQSRDTVNLHFTVSDGIVDER